MRELSSVVFVKYLLLRHKLVPVHSCGLFPYVLGGFRKKFRIGGYAYTITGVYIYRAAGHPDDLILFDGIWFLWVLCMELFLHVTPRGA